MAQPYKDGDTFTYIGTFDETKVEVIGYEYGQDPNVEAVLFSPTLPTHKVAWIRPRFGKATPEGHIWVDAHDCWPESNNVVNEIGDHVMRPAKGTMLLVKLPEEFRER